jgi:hypothetical protein
MLPPAPRPLTPRARRRSWNERPVRLWLILTVGIALITIYFAIYYTNRALHERQLIERGTKVQATVELIDTFGRPDRTFTRDQVRVVRARYTLDGKTFAPDMELPIKSGTTIRVGETIELRADPNDPSIVTAQTRPRSWPASLAVVLLLAPLTALLAFITLWQRARVLNVWQNGEPADATVVDWHRSGIAPRSVLVRFTLDVSDDRRVLSTLWPRAAGELEAGETIQMLVPRGAPQRAVASELYQ